MFPLSGVKIVLVTSVGTKIFVPIMEVFLLRRRVSKERFYCTIKQILSLFQILVFYLRRKFY